MSIKTTLIKCKDLCKRIYILDSWHQNFDSIFTVNSFFTLLWWPTDPSETVVLSVSGGFVALCPQEDTTAQHPKPAPKPDRVLPDSGSVTLRTHPERERAV